MTSSCDRLKTFFAELNEVRVEQDAHGYENTRDQFACVSLKIIAALLEDNGLGRVIAKELALDVDFDDGISSKNDLMGDLEDIDRVRDEDERGFANLMSLILEDTDVKLDPEVALAKIDDIEPSSVSAFTRMARAFEALFKIEEAYGMAYPKAAATIFLLMLKDVAQDPSMAKQAIVRGLATMSADKKELLELHRQATAMSCQLFENLAKTSFTKNLVVIVLCLWSADQHVLKNEEAQHIDQILCSLGMLGVKPLVASGFLELHDGGKNAHHFVISFA